MHAVVASPFPSPAGAAEQADRLVTDVAEAAAAHLRGVGR